MLLSVIIVNYRAANHIINCINSVPAAGNTQLYEWIIVDNDSDVNSKAILTQQFPFIRWIDMQYNAGYARGNNAGIQQAKGEVVLLLNPDTIIIEDAIAQCFHRFVPSLFVACSVQLLNADRTTQITGNFFMKGGLNHLLSLPYLGTFLRRIALALKIKKTNVPIASAEEIVDWINGAFLMVKKSAIEKSGLLDEDFFLYAEEIEWCSRLKKSGQLCVYGDLFTIHLLGETINAATASAEKGYSVLHDKKGLQLMVSQHVRIRKQFGAGWFIFHLLMHTIEIPVFSFCSLIDHLLHKKNPFTNLPKIEGYTNNVLKLWSLSPKIIYKTPYFYKMF